MRGILSLIIGSRLTVHWSRGKGGKPPLCFRFRRSFLVLALAAAHISFTIINYHILYMSEYKEKKRREYYANDESTTQYVHHLLYIEYSVL